MAAITATTFEDFLKSLWPQDRVFNLAMRDRPFLALVPKDGEFYGKNQVVTVQYSNTPGRSADFARAQANKGSMNTEAFTVTRKKDYSLADVENEVIEASEKDIGSLAAAWDRSTKAAFEEISDSMAVDLYKAGTGSRGKVATSDISGNTVTLAQKRDIFRFAVGQVLKAGPNDSSSGIRSGTMTITSVNRKDGKFTCSGGLVAGLADADFLFVDGDQSAKLTGLKGWLPYTDPSGGESFFGVDRSVDRERLAGVPIDISDKAPYEGAIKAITELHTASSKMATHWFMHPDQAANIEYDAANKIRTEELKLGDIGFRALVVKGTVKIIADPFCDYDTSYLLKLDTWKLSTLKGAPRFLRNIGPMGRALDASDANELRIGYYGNLYTDAPGWNAVVNMPT